MCVGQAIGLLVSMLISYAVKRRKRRNNNPKKYELNRGSHHVVSREQIPGKLTDQLTCDTRLTNSELG